MNKITLLKKLDSIVGVVMARLLLQPKFVSIDTVVERVLFIRPGGIGDAVLLIPAIQALKKTYPDCQIDILAEKRNSQIFSLCQGVRRVYRYDNLSDFLAVLKTQYDVVIDTEQWHRLSAIIARLIRSQCKVGFATNERAKMFTVAAPYSHDIYETSSFFNLLQPLNIVPTLSLPTPFLDIPTSVKSSAQLLGSAIGKYVVLFPGASIPERCWSADRFSTLAVMFAEQKLGVVIVGGREDCGSAETITESVPNIINLAGKTSLLETAAILKDAALLVSGDSGVLHIGVGLGIPTVSLFGPGIAAKWTPQGSCHRVINLDLPCSPCTQFGTTPPCPIGAKCLHDISVPMVFSAAQDLLELNNKKS